jgi:hypothetical protein
MFDIPEVADMQFVPAIEFYVQKKTDRSWKRNWRARGLIQKSLNGHYPFQSLLNVLLNECLS